MHLMRWFIVMLFGSLASNTSVALENDASRKRDTFSYSFKWGVKEYSIAEPSGCATIISMGEDSSRIDIMYGGACERVEKSPESMHYIAGSIKALISKYELIGEFKAKERVSVNISWLFSHWPIIDFVNETSWWPNDFQKEIQGKYSKKEKLTAYREIFEKAILDKNSYGAVLTVFDEFGCELTLAKSFADPMDFGGMSFDKDVLIEFGVFSALEVNKLKYPKIKGPVIFDLNCTKGE